MKELALLHDKHMNRPTLDDSSEEEHAIEITTQEITQVLSLYSLVFEILHIFLDLKSIHLFKLFAIGNTFFSQSFLICRCFYLRTTH